MASEDEYQHQDLFRKYPLSYCDVYPSTGQKFVLKIKASWLGKMSPLSNRFKIALFDNPFNRGDVMTIVSYGREYKITRSYRMRWWKKILTKLKIKRTPWFIGVKVKEI